MVDPNGRQVVDPPLATCEEQGFVYVSKLSLAEVLRAFGRKDEAAQLKKEAAELKENFNQAFWLEEEQYIALALQEDGRPVRAIASNAGHCIATGILDERYVRPVAERLFRQDLFSGWGIHTLSSDNPAYNPHSYHRVRFGRWNRALLFSN